MLNVPFKKVHGSRNDFLLIDHKDLPSSFTYQQKQQLTVLLCDRENGIGADGILFVSVGGRTDGVMQIFNSDGSEASMCGNGLRCAGRYILEKTGKDQVIVETLKADLYVKKYHETKTDIPFYQVEISPVLFEPTSLPMKSNLEKVVNEKLDYLSHELTFTAVAVPNPHLISIVTKEILLSEEQGRIAKYVNGENPYFPDGVNVSFVYPIKAGEVFVNTYERGVGFTNACGTAMSASSLVTILQGLHQFEKPLVVYNNGGYVQTIVHNQNGKQWIDLIGNGTYSFDGNVEVDMEKALMTNLEKTYHYDEEELQYQQMEKKAKDVILSVFGKEQI
ncbi:diaminopimelate epimerase [Caldibacillus lycopersici]|uniref:Diaminopimelate epimerase n=1 Tax=Perspicuibacillus lycopersici TaxID=1325689 RepID=A0AAE3IVE7_9BACI|nr:diaminopimelate epimerase [Perspicuibacillus lycopersici]MCU9613604.1 diaminopimelate epimerase [Perspicuibacillus lycopersici]